MISSKIDLDEIEHLKMEQYIKRIAEIRSEIELTYSNPSLSGTAKDLATIADQEEEMKYQQ